MQTDKAGERNFSCFMPPNEVWWTTPKEFKPVKDFLAMKTKLILALEADTLPDTKGAEDLEEGESTGLDASQVEPIDSEESALEDTPSEGGDEKQDLVAPIVYPEIGNLNVDQVDEVLREEQTESEQASQNALSETQQLIAAVESMVVSMRATGAVDPSMAASSVSFLIDCKRRLGYPDLRLNYTLEDFSAGEPEKASLVALENYRTVIRQVWEALIQALVRALAWLKKAFLNFFYSVKKTKEETLALSNAVITQRGDTKTGAFFVRRQTQIVDDSNYVSLPHHAAWLTHKGKQPGDYSVDVYQDFKLSASHKPSYAEAFLSILEVTKMHAAYQSAFGEKFVSEMALLCESIVDDQAVDVSPELLDVSSLVAPNAYGDTNIPGKVAQPGLIYAINEGYLGDFIITHLHNPNIDQHSTLEEGIKALGDWKAQLHYDKSTKHNGSLRFLTNEEITLTSKAVMEIENELFKYERTLDAMAESERELKKIAEAAAEVTLTQSKDYFSSSAPEGWKGQAMNSIIAAINSAVGNMNSSVFEQSRCAHTACNAWNAYLQATYKADKLFLQNK
jgi:hypothetical protein